MPAEPAIKLLCGKKPGTEGITELKSKLNARHSSFLPTMLKNERLFLIGNEDELARLARSLVLQ